MPTFDTETIVMFAAVTALLAVLLIIKLIAFFYEYNKDTQYIRIEMNETTDDKERRYWRQKLVYHRLCLIPFVTERNVERVYAVFHRGRHARKEQKSIVRVFAPLVLGLAVCLVSLSGLTYAWFTATLQGSAQTIRSAAFHVTVNVTADANEAVTLTENKGLYMGTLAAGKTYTFVMQAAEDSTASRGFCKIVVTDNGNTAGTPYYTATFSNTESYTISYTPEKTMTVTVEPIWGEVEKQLPKVATVENNGTIGRKTPATVSTTTTTRTTTTTTKSAVAKTSATTAAPTTTTTTTSTTTAATTTTLSPDADDES